MENPSTPKRARARIGGSAAIALLLAACSRDTPPPRQASQPPEQPVVAEAPAFPSNPSNDIGDDEASVQVSPEVRERCQLPSSPHEVPRFDYDQARLRTRGANILDDVARCLSDGALKGQKVTIIGRADPRGPTEYNQELGVSRAEAARDYLEERGVPAESLLLLSRGEQGARGHDEETWALDRRVDLELGDHTGGTNGALTDSSGQSEPSGR